MKAFALLAVAFVCVCAQEESAATATTPDAADTTADTTPPVDITGAQTALAMQVMQEQQVAKTYLSIVLRLQHAQYVTLASHHYTNMLLLELTDDNDANVFLELDAAIDAEFSHDLEETSSDSLFSTQPMSRQLDLMASLSLFYSIKIKLYQTLFYAVDVQQEFWGDRAMMYTMSLAGDSIPTPLVQLMYIKSYRTMLETVKLSVAMQVVSHWTMWLEDAIDVNTVFLANDGDYSHMINEQEADDLIRDKMFAFSAFQQFANLDLIVFYMDWYLESMFMQAMGGATAAPAADADPNSFLEEEEEAEPFVPTMAAVGLYNPMYALKLYKLYSVLFTVQASQGAITSVMAESMAYQRLVDDDLGNDEEAFRYMSFAQHMFGGSFATGLGYAAQMEQLTALFELYMMYAPMMMAGQQAAAAAPAATP